MTLESPSEPEFLMTRAVLPVEMRNPPAASLSLKAAFLGVRLPVRPCDGTLRGLADADGAVFAVLIPTASPRLDQERADLIAAAINAGLGFAGVAARTEA